MGSGVRDGGGWHTQDRLHTYPLPCCMQLPAADANGNLMMPYPKGWLDACMCCTHLHAAYSPPHPLAPLLLVVWRGMRVLIRATFA